MAERPRRCGWPGCTEKPLTGRRACAEHAPIYDRVREDLAKPRERGPVKRNKTVRLLCTDDDCTEYRKSGSRYCEEHTDE